MFRRLLFSLTAILCLYACCIRPPDTSAAGKYLYEAPVATAVDDSSLLPVSETDSSTTLKKITVSALRALMGITASGDTIYLTVETVTADSIYSVLTVIDTLWIDNFSGLLKATAGLVDSTTAMPLGWLSRAGGAYGKVIKWNPTTSTWTVQNDSVGTVDGIIPDQSGHSGEYLSTNGSTLSWDTPAGAGDMMAADFPDSLTAGLTRDTLFLRRLDVNDSLLTGYGIEKLGTAWLDSTFFKNFGIGFNNLQVNSIDSTKIRPLSISTGDLAGGGALTLDQLTVNNLYVGDPIRWATPLPTFFDSVTVADQDSGTVRPHADVSLPSEYAVSLEFVGNGTAPVDTLIMIDVFLPVYDEPDTAYFYVWADTVSTTDAGYLAEIKWKGTAAADTLTIISEAGAVGSASTWERVAVPLYNDFTNDMCTVYLRATVSLAHVVRMSRVYFKGQ